MDNKILRTLSYGIYAIGVKGPDKPSACIVNTVFQITSDPAVIAVSLNHNNHTNELIKKTSIFTVSVFSEDTSGAVIGALGFTSGKDVDKLKNVNHKISQEGLPVIKENICCWFSCKVVNQVETSTHTVFLAEIVSGSNHFVGNPMTYKYYHEVIKGSAPKNAPTYQPEEHKNLENTDVYVCKICGYVYNDPHVPFEDLPDSWVCPICKAPKSEFRLK